LSRHFYAIDFLSEQCRLSQRSFIFREVVTMPCLAEVPKQTPVSEWAAIFNDSLNEAREAGDESSFREILGRAIAAAPALFGSEDLINKFTGALPTWAAA
jgi:hypothetical protein